MREYNETHFLFRFSVDSPLVNLTRGVALLELASAVDEAVRIPTDEPHIPQLTIPSARRDALYESWDEAARDATFVEYVASKLPPSIIGAAAALVTTGGTVLPTADSFLRHGRPLRTADFLYDAVFTMGYAMCNSPTPFLAGSDIVAELANVDWEGYTGTLRYNAQRAREKDTLSYTLVQIQPIEVNATTMRLTVTPTSFLGSTETNETNTSNTTTRVWQSIRPFVYADGTTKVPSDVQPLEVVVDVMVLGRN